MIYSRRKPAARRINPAAARAAWFAAVALVGLCLWLSWLNHLAPRRYIEEYILALVLGALSFATVGGLITTRRPENRIGWLLSAAGVMAGAMGVTQQYARYTLVTHPGALPAAELVGWLNIWIWVPLVSLFLYFLPLLFPTGRLPSPRWRPVVGLMVIAVVTLTLGVAINPGPVDASMPEVRNPFAPAWGSTVQAWLTPLGILLNLASLAAAVAAPVVRMRRSAGVERQQIKWFAFAAGVIALCFLIPIAIYFPNFTNQTFLSGLLLSIGFPVVPAAVGTAVLRYRLYDIDLLIRRTLVYTALTILLALVYLASVLVLQQALVAFSGASSPLVIVASTLLIAGLFNPLRLRVHRFIDRLFFRQKYDASRVMTAFSTYIASEVDLERLSERTIETVEQNLQPDQVSLWIIRDR